MNKFLHLGCWAALMSGVAFSQSPAAQNNAPADAKPPAEEMRFTAGGSFRVELDKTIDAKKAKPGDPVVLKTLDRIMSGDREIAPSGSKIYGHVVEVTPHQGETPSTLGIAFDKMDLGKGTEVPFKAAIQAIGRPPDAVNFGGSDPASGSAAPGGAPAGGYGGRAGGMASGGSTGSSSNPPAAGSPQLPRAGNLPPDAQGVIGMSGVTLGTGTQKESMLTSQKHNVKLESGTQMIVRTE